MLAVAAVIWVVLGADATTTRVDVGRGWTVAGVADATLTPLFTYPDYENGLRLRGGFRFAHQLGENAEFIWAGRAGATRVDDWRGLFESSVGVAWNRIGVDIRAGVRHDDRLSREGPRSGFRDPTGRVWLQADVLPIRKGWFAAGATVEYQRGMPGALRLPSSASAAVVVRVHWRCCT
jgi:hypothetical protein